jgi:DNA-binding IclR family transcriptional regulator
MLETHAIDRGPGGSAAVSKAFRVLNAFTVEQPWLSLSQLAAACAMPVSTASRLLAALERVGAVRRDAATLRYSVGAGVLPWARIAQLTLAAHQDVRQTLVELASATGETAAVYLHQGQGGTRICIDVVQSTQPVHRAIPLGEVAPLTSGAAGRVIVSYLPDAEQQALNLDVASMAQLREVRRLGLVCTYRDRLKDAWAIAAPLKNERGETAAALVLTGPISRYRPTLFLEWGALVREAARACSLRSGAPPATLRELDGPISNPVIFGAEPGRGAGDGNGDEVETR